MINDLDPNIKFTMEKNNSHIAFLDISVKKSGNSLNADIYYKPTDSKSYLDFNSCHPRNTKTNVTYNLARRICTICNHMTDRDKRLLDLEKYLINRNYPKLMNTTAINKAKSHNITELRKVSPPKNEDENMITFAHIYNPRHSNIFSIVQESRSILEGSPAMKELIDNTRLINSKCPPPNLKTILTKTAFDNKPFKGEVNKYGNERCGCCKFRQTGNSFFLL